MYGPPPSQLRGSSSVTGRVSLIPSVPIVLVNTNFRSPASMNSQAMSSTLPSPSTLVRNNGAGSRSHILASTTQ